MIIWGSRGVSKTMAQGTFYCPQCTQERGYEHKRSRQFFTLYFIPIFPMGDLGEFVECTTCKGTFVTGVLQSDPREGIRRARAEIVEALCTVLGHVAAADGPIGDTVAAMIVAALKSEFGAEENENLLDSRIRRSAKDGNLARALEAAAKGLTEPGKESVMKLAARVARAGSSAPLTERQIGTLRRIGEGFDMSSAHLRGIMAEITESATT